MDSLTEERDRYVSASTSQRTIVWAFFSILLYLVDNVFDCFYVFELSKLGMSTYFWVSIGLVLCSFLLYAIANLYLYRNSSSCERVVGFFFGPLARNIERIKIHCKAIKTRKIPQRKGDRLKRFFEVDILTTLIEVFFESIPQLILQIILLVKHSAVTSLVVFNGNETETTTEFYAYPPGHSMSFYTNSTPADAPEPAPTVDVWYIMYIISILKIPILILLFAGWINQYETLRHNLDEQRSRMNWPSFFTNLIWRSLDVTSRIGLFIVAFLYFPMLTLFVPAHFVLVVIWRCILRVCYYRKKEETSTTAEPNSNSCLQDVLFDSYISLFTFVKLRPDSFSIEFWVHYALFAIEYAGIFVLALICFLFNYALFTETEMALICAASLGACFLFSILCLKVYYYFRHANRRSISNGIA